MEKTVFGDLLFFVNFCMDFQCLFLTAKLLHRPFSTWRAALFSAIGAVYAVAALFLSTSGVAAFFLDCGVCLLMCFGTFFQKGQGTVRVFSAFLVYFGVSFAVGGAMSGMAALLSHIELPIGTESDVSAGLFYLLAAAGGISTFLWGRFTARRAGQTHATLRVTLDGTCVSFFAMVDTANLLVDPASGRPVVLLSVKAAKRLFSPPVLELCCTGNTAALATLPHDTARRVRLCPTSAATGEKLLFAILPDIALLDTGGDARPVDILLAPVPLHTGFDGAEALLPAELLTA